MKETLLEIFLYVLLVVFLVAGFFWFRSVERESSYDVENSFVIDQ